MVWGSRVIPDWWRSGLSIPVRLSAKKVDCIGCCTILGVKKVEVATLEEMAEGEASVAAW